MNEGGCLNEEEKVGRFGNSSLSAMALDSIKVRHHLKRQKQFILEVTFNSESVSD